MAFHFVNFNLVQGAFAYGDFSIEFPGGGVPYPLDIVCYSQPADRYVGKAGVLPSVCVQLTAQQLPLLPSDFSGFVVERSDDGGITWVDVSGDVTDSFFWVDVPPAPGTYQYRARMRVSSGTLGDPGNVVEVLVGTWDDADALGVNELASMDGSVIQSFPRAVAFPYGFDGEAHTGMSISEGSAGGGYAGAWYIRTREFEPPVVQNNVPACGSVGVALPLTVITFDIQDKPYPVGGSGIDDSTLQVRLGVTSQYGGSLITVRSGAVEPFAPTITCSVVPGVDPLLDRSVTITVPAGYIQTDDVVTIETTVSDLDGNTTVHDCSFSMEHVDVIPPEIVEEEPECGTGIDPDDDRRVSRDSSFSFRTYDDDSGVDTTTLQVWYGPSNVGPWTQVLLNGSTWLLGFSGTVAVDPMGGYRVTVRRPVLDPLWPPDSVVCFKVQVQDLMGNLAEETCCFKTRDLTSLARVVPIAEDIVYLEFSEGMSNDHALRTPSNYSISPVDPVGKLVSIRSVSPHLFEDQADPEAPSFRLGEGNPFFVYLNTTNHEPWSEYDLTVGPGVKDRYGLSLVSPGNVGRYRGRRTKVDEGRDGMEGDDTKKDGLVRRIMVGVGHSDEAIGGTHIDDDWKES